MSSTFLDLRTLSVVLMLVILALSLIMTFIWRTHRTYAGFALWTLSNVVAASGFLFLSLRGAVPDWLTILAANSCTLGSMLFGLEGNRRFVGLKPSVIFSLALLFTNAVGLAYFTYVDNDVVIRIAITSSLLAVIGGVNAFQFNRAASKEGNITYRFVSAIYVAFSLLMIIRAVSTYAFSAIKQYYAPDWIQSSSYIVFLIYAIMLTFSYVVLNNERLQEELKATKSEFEKLATTDFLTGINNNRRFFEVGSLEIQRARRFHHPLTVIMFDLDHFKKINDTYGHAAGDRVLMEMVDICKYNLRDLDSIGRLGGEEFGIILPHTDIDVGKMVAGRLRRAFDETEIANSPTNIRITASFGVTELYDDDLDLKALLSRADVALYEAKQNGRNQVKASASFNQIILANLPKITSEQVM